MRIHCCALNFFRLGAIDVSLYSYPERHSEAQLQSLRLVGQALSSLPGDIGESRCSLRYVHTLALPANDLTSLPDSLCELRALTHLNLLRNKLTRLPERIGQLGALRVLELAGNRLHTLPANFGGLLLLKRVVLDCNRLTHLPETLGTLRCTRLSLNCNR
jgi:Leucine-rich repeat (LRR) protein